jgi:hypothetical protein
MGRHHRASISVRSARSSRARPVASRASWPATTGWSCGCACRAAGWPARTTRPTSTPRRITTRPTIRSWPPSSQARPGGGATSTNASSDSPGTTPGIRRKGQRTAALDGGRSSAGGDKPAVTLDVGPPRGQSWLAAGGQRPSHGGHQGPSGQAEKSAAPALAALSRHLLRHNRHAGGEPLPLR